MDLSDNINITDDGTWQCTYIINLSYCEGNEAFCEGISDVSSLGNVCSILNLSGCTYVDDVSYLGVVHILDLEDFVGIEDVSTLGNVFELNISGCNKIQDITFLRNVNILKTKRCDGITSR